MASLAAARLKLARTLPAAVFLLVCCAPAQTRLSLLDFEARVAPDYVPAHLNEKVILRGVVNAPAFHFPGYSVLGIQDERAGAILYMPETDQRLDQFHPGDYIEARGLVSRFAGNVTLVPEQVEKIGSRQAPAPVSVRLEELMGFRYLGMLVSSDGKLRDSGENSAGAFLTLSASSGSRYRLFIPHASGQTPVSINDFGAGDVVGATGLAFQYCTRPPYNTSFELLVRAPNALVAIQRSWIISPLALFSGIGVAVLVGMLLWKREERLRSQRERLRKTHQLGEEILGASSTDAILSRLSTDLPKIFGVTGVRLYVHNRAAKALDSVPAENEAPVSIPLSASPGGPPTGAVACFHYQTELAIPEIERSPFEMGVNQAGAPKSLLFVPLKVQGSVVGVLELHQHDRVRDFTADEQQLAGHLGNQIGVALRLLDQRSVQEQLFRTEKLAAVGRLISGVVNELQTPLTSISDLACRLREKTHGAAFEREVSAIAAESEKAVGMVARLVSFAAAEQREARPVSIGGLLRTLIEFREGDWKASGIKILDLTTGDPIYVHGLQGQLEQVFLNLLVHAEQSLADSAEKSIAIRTSVLGRRVLVEISFSASSQTRQPEETAAVLGITRSVIGGHGGEVRLVEPAGADPRFEVELPATIKERTGPQAAATAAAPRARAVDKAGLMTALVVEPDEGAQRQMLALLYSRGIRVVPVSHADTGLELAQRMRFDVTFCSMHAPGLNWVELSERMHLRVGAFILVADGYDPELAADFEGEAKFVLPKPIQESELDRILDAMESAAVLTRGTA